MKAGVLLRAVVVAPVLLWGAALGCGTSGGQCLNPQPLPPYTCNQDVTNGSSSSSMTAPVDGGVAVTTVSSTGTSASASGSSGAASSSGTGSESTASSSTLSAPDAGTSSDASTDASDGDASFESDASDGDASFESDASRGDAEGGSDASEDTHDAADADDAAGFHD
jgi:hypothetical protein